MTLPFRYLITICLWALALANVEKEIFIGPPTSMFDITTELEHLTPSNDARNFATTLNTSFVHPGATHWIALSGLAPQQRYEVRICWPATQPTDFNLKLFTVEQIDGDTALSSSIHAYPKNIQRRLNRPYDGGSTLYLRIFAKTAYVSAQKSRMETPEPVDVEIILDPYKFNVLPESLVPIGGLLIVVGVFSWWAGGLIHQFLARIVTTDEDKKRV
ncbi:hypothetical protein EDC01DRAFT_532480 [Geopyxis carbonaria]|nr:hypothetical protein EDC01DRAFT_532480 [Geopyxis carbonaria]